MDFNNKLSELRKVQEQCLNLGENINNKIQQDLDIICNQVISKHTNDIQECYQRLQKVEDELVSIYKIVGLCAVFDERIISKVISEIISTFEGSNFVYQYTKNYTEENIKNHKYSVVKMPKIIVSEKYKKYNYYDNTNNDLNELVKKGHALVLVDNTIDIQHVIAFYKFNNYTENLEQCVDYGKFGYVKEFIDTLISYKIDNDVLSISDQIINMLKVKFICSKCTQIRKNYELRDKLKEENEIIKEISNKPPKIKMPKI